MAKKYKLVGKDIRIIEGSETECDEKCPTGDIHYDYRCANPARFERDGENLCVLHARRSGWIFN